MTKRNIDLTAVYCGLSRVWHAHGDIRNGVSCREVSVS